MVLLPVVAREMRVAARGRAIYRVRFYAVLVMLGLFLWFLKGYGASFRNSSQLGQEVMIPLIICAFVFSLFIGVLATADCVSCEKRDGTLGLLFLTDLKGYDVICGKLAASSINAVYGLLAILPILGLPVMMGGVTFAQFVKFGIGLFSTMVFSLVTGIFVSTHSRNERKAMFFTIFLLLAVVILPIFLTAWCEDAAQYTPQKHDWIIKHMWMGFLFSPAYGVGQTMVSTSSIYPFPAFSFWLSVLWQWLAAVALIVWASVRVPYSWEESGAKKEPGFQSLKTIIGAKSRGPRGRAWLERNPFLWLALQGDEASPERVWLFVAAILVIWAIIVMRYGISLVADEGMVAMTIWIMHTPLKIWIVAEASRRFSEDRSNHTFESLLSTPLSPRQIIHGQWLALLRQFAAPIAVVLAWEFCLTIYSSRHRSWEITEWADYTPDMLLLVTDAISLGWAGMWFGLKYKGRIRAILGSLALVLCVRWVITQIILSRLSFRLPGIIARMAVNPLAWKQIEILALLLPGILLDLGLVVWFRSHLQKNFRRLASQR